ncbi:MAG: Aspartate/glutamate/uridylate kinase [Parcubacteria group bacterium GW2011_GWC1_45_9]|nr:MAG: Aspartate/glutamate/uridylate kinase [Parcubacteria group bacterium GW2011_GWA1_Parcubacteria_45_10]KKT88821.1 MAG: Aspartate/glutamate/uridylate kinase [Parcubacteria group bacterium GW2011_GWB1_45_10]KKU16969.1 MAG: Aspartate/glutamate/uridylate kinase [Parcubacteria group bacterium GW2011_GWC1_45_9]HCI05146.1 UMP kinase [Patescibacteria group bacterium]
MNTEKTIISLGGSLIVPNGEIDVLFLRQFNLFIRKQLSDKNRQFFIVVGGGTLARHYRDAGRKILKHELTKDDLDWLGIHATRLNAHLIRTIFRDKAHPFIIKHYEIIRKVKEPIVVASGWKPGWSTDYCAVLLAQDYGAKNVINLSVIDRAYTKDPKKNRRAKPIDRISWKNFRKIVGNQWRPGMNAPFDPIASKLAEKLKLRVTILNGRNFDNLKKFLNKEKFVGTVIE